MGGGGGGEEVLRINGLMGMCRWMGSHFHGWIDYIGVAFSTVSDRVTRTGSQIVGILGVRKFWLDSRKKKLLQKEL